MKSATEDASLGIAQASIVYDGRHLQERVEFIHEQTNSDALVEEYIEGRELYIGVMGNERLTTFPVWELNFGTLPDVMSIATRKVKWDRKYQQRHGIGTGPARDLPTGLAMRLALLARRIYRALSLSGYARIDLRLQARRQRLRARGKRKPEPRADRGFRDVGVVRRRGLRRGAAADHAMR